MQNRIQKYMEAEADSRGRNWVPVNQAERDNFCIHCVQMMAVCLNEHGYKPEDQHYIRGLVTVKTMLNCMIDFSFYQREHAGRNFLDVMSDCMSIITSLVVNEIVTISNIKKQG